MKNDLNKMKMPHWSKLLGWFFVLILVITFFDMVNENGKEAFGLKHTQKTQNSLFCMTTKKTGDPFQLRIPYFIQEEKTVNNVTYYRSSFNPYAEGRLSLTPEVISILQLVKIPCSEARALRP